MGAEAVDVRRIGMTSAKDSEVYSYAIKEQYCLVTADFGFADVRRYPPIEHFGMIVFHLPPVMKLEQILSLIESFIAQMSDKFGDLSGRLVIVDRNKIRIRPPFVMDN